MSQLQDWLDVLLATIRDVLPILGILFGFQVLVLRQTLPNLRRVLTGFLYVFLGMAMFLEGLEHALFPLGKLIVLIFFSLFLDVPFQIFIKLP